VSGLYLPSEDDFNPLSDDFFDEFQTKERRYKHFDLPVDPDQKLEIPDFSQNDSPRRFWPLLGFTKLARRYIRNSSGEREIKNKERPIRFCSHSDAAYLQCYGVYLNKFYEHALEKYNLSSSVLAYRAGGGTNIHHAKSLFDEISEHKNCTVYAMDISGFFDNLNHKYLRDRIASLIDVEWITGHHFTVWKNITSYSWVDIEDIRSKLKNIYGKNKKSIREETSSRICSPIFYKKYIRNRNDIRIHKNNGNMGIPQGTPISGLYANIYMIEFDKYMISLCGLFGGSYRRYSDDIAILIPEGVSSLDFVEKTSELLSICHLKLSESKTDIASFKDGFLSTQKPIQYLGFTFDGREILIRQSSIDAYLRKMRRGIHAKMVAAKMQGIPYEEVYKREALSRYTHLGQRRNFISYAYRAAEIMRSDSIRHQIGKHMTWFRRCWLREKKTFF